MPASFNKVQLMGNVGQNPEIRSFQNGGRVATLTLATSKKWKDKKTGEAKEMTEWHRIQIFNEAIIKACEKFVSKGTHLYIEGALETRKWTDKDGKDHYATEVTVRPFNGEMKVLSYRDDKAPEEELQDMPEDIGAPIPA